VTRALDAFPPTQVTMAGEAIDLPPKHALALSLTLHELATNATKYGALSRPQGHVRVEWRAKDGMLHLDWAESGGPKVVQPIYKGFGSRLLDVLIRDLDGTAKVDFNHSGVHCTIEASLSGAAPAVPHFTEHELHGAIERLSGGNDHASA
jgi:two-component sensor histidine kinase